MKPNLLLASSAIFLAAAGLAGTFLPQELLAAAGVAQSPTLLLLVQLHAAVLLGFAMTNWLARGSAIGGIYNRPLAVGNVAHFVIGALALAKAAIAGERAPAIVAAAVIYAVFAIAFGRLLFRSGIRE